MKKIIDELEINELTREKEKFDRLALWSFVFSAFLTFLQLFISSIFGLYWWRSIWFLLFFISWTLGVAFGIGCSLVSWKKRRELLTLYEKILRGDE